MEGLRWGGSIICWRGLFEGGSLCSKSRRPRCEAGPACFYGELGLAHDAIGCVGSSVAFRSIIAPLEGLKIPRIVCAAIGDSNNMIHFPSMDAIRVSVVGPADYCSADVLPKHHWVLSGDLPGLPPDGGECRMIERFTPASRSWFSCRKHFVNASFRGLRTLQKNGAPLPKLTQLGGQLMPLS